MSAAATPTFLSQARLRAQPVASVNYTSEADAGNPHIQPLRNVGYLQRVSLVAAMTGQYATAGPSATDPLGILSGPIGRVTLRANSVGVIFDTAGYFLPIISGINAAYEQGSIGPTFLPAPYTFTAAPGTAAFANKFAYEIPVSVDLDNWPAPLGLYQTAISGNETDLEIRFTAFAGATTAPPGTAVYLGNQANLGSPACPVSVQQVYFDPIATLAAQPPYIFIHKWVDQQFALVADGDTDLMLNNANIYLRFIILVVTGAAGALAPNATQVTRIRLMYGGNIAPIDYTVDQLRARQARLYGAAAVPSGFYILDFLSEPHTERDAINASASTDLRLTVTTSGATYSGGAYCRVAMEMLVPLTAPGASVGVQGPVR